MVKTLPDSVRYIKNGMGGRWWAEAKARGELHAGWPQISEAALTSSDPSAVTREFASSFDPRRRGYTQDLNQLLALIDRPSQHVWVTFEDGFMWWCTVQDAVSVNPDGESRARGHFWLTCAQPWTNCSLAERDLATANLPGSVTAASGFRGTVCRPEGWREILRVLRDEADPHVLAAQAARNTYEAAVWGLVSKLRHRDFEDLIDLILSRAGWARVRKLGGVTEGIDVEVENPATGEIAFVQVKSRAGQSQLDDYATRFQARRDRYDRMIFVVHSPLGALNPPGDDRVQVWAGLKVAQLVVRHGLGDWVARRI